MQRILFVFSNKTHFETALPILKYLKNKYKFLAIFNLIDSTYSKGLEKYLEEHNNLFEEIFLISNKSFIYKHIINFLKIKKLLSKWLKEKNIISSIQFIEGGYIDWLVIGILKENNIKTIVLQWAITWSPFYYNKKNKDIFFKTQLIKKVVKKIFMIDYPTMRYLGDGNADYLLTMGEFWTKNFLKYHNYPNKFITTGNPRFLNLLKLKNYSDKKDILFITGAGTSLYGYSKNDHLEDIKEVYFAYSNSNISNKLIHKIHPRDIYKDDILELSKEYKNIIVEMEKITTELLKRTFLSIVIRSTVGFEALISGSKLIVYNNNRQTIGFNYAEYELAKEAKNIKELSYLLKNHNMIDKPKENTIEYYIKTKNILEDIENVIKN